MIYRFCMLMRALVMAGMVRVTLRSGATVTFRRDARVTKAEMVEDMRNVMNLTPRVLRYTRSNRKPVVIRSEEIAFVEVW